MARRTQGERRVPAIVAIRDAQGSGERNALDALRRYRQQGGSIRTQEWYRMWREEQQLGLPKGPGPEERERSRGKATNRWTTNVAVVYLEIDPDTGLPSPDRPTVTQWHQIQSPPGRGNRISDVEAMQRAIDQGYPAVRRSKTMPNFIPVSAYVTSYDWGGDL